MAKKKQIVDDSGADLEQFGTIFDHLESHRTPAKPEPAPAAPAVDVSALLAKIDALSGTVNALASRPAPAPQTVYTPVPSATAPKFEWADPVTEPEAFGSTLAAYTTYVLEQRKAAEDEERAARAQHTNRAASLWNEFTATHPEFAEKADQVGYIARKVADSVAQRGIDINEYQTVNKSGYFNDVISEYTKVFGPIKQETGTDPDEEGRTAGIFGGFESGGQPAKGKEAPGDMLKDLKDIQRASGFF